MQVAEAMNSRSEKEGIRKGIKVHLGAHRRGTAITMAGV